MYFYYYVILDFYNRILFSNLNDWEEDYLIEAILVDQSHYYYYYYYYYYSNYLLFIS
jgi:hypothetical protein